MGKQLSDSDLLRVAVYYSPLGQGQHGLLCLLPKGYPETSKAVMTVVSSYLGGADVVKHFNPVPKSWGLF